MGQVSVTKNVVKVNSNVGKSSINVNLNTGPKGDTGAVSIVSPITNTGTATNAIIGIDQSLISINPSQVIGTAVVTTDSRLSDSRTPTAHTHAATDITSGTFDIARLPVVISGTSNATQVVRADDSRLSDNRNPKFDYSLTGARVIGYDLNETPFSNITGQAGDVYIGRRSITDITDRSTTRRSPALYIQNTSTNWQEFIPLGLNVTNNGSSSTSTNFSTYTVSSKSVTAAQWTGSSTSGNPIIDVAGLPDAMTWDPGSAINNLSGKANSIAITGTQSGNVIDPNNKSFTGTNKIIDSLYFALNKSNTFTGTQTFSASQTKIQNELVVGGGTSGAVTLPYLAITGATTLGATHYTVNCTSAGFTVTLPTAVGITGRTYVIKNTAASGTITIATTSSQLIDGASTKSLTTQYSSLVVQSTGSGWIVIN